MAPKGFRVKRRLHSVNGKAYGPGDIIPGDLLPRPDRLVKLGWVEPVYVSDEPIESPVAEAPALDPEQEPEPEQPKRKRGRPRKQK